MNGVGYEMESFSPPSMKKKKNNQKPLGEIETVETGLALKSENVERYHC